MADLTIGEIGVVLQVTLQSLDSSQNPPVQIPLDLTGATVTLLYVLSSPNEKPKTPVSRNMTIVGTPTAGVVKYTFASNDLVAPPEVSKNGVFRYSIKIVFPSGTVFYTNEDAQLTVKDDSSL